MATPDPKFFRALAEKRDEPADLAFFTLMEKSIATTCRSMSSRRVAACAYATAKT